VAEARAKGFWTTTEEERPHHAESASSLQPKEWCPAYTSRDTTNEAAELGTLQHYAAETGDLSGLDDEQAEKVVMCLDFIQGRFDAIKKDYPDAKLETEVYGDIDEVEWPTMNERSTSGGFVDVVISFDEGRRAEIWDYKFGKWPVETPDNNLQGIVYVLNQRHRCPQLKEATVGFMMPYLGKIQKHTFTEEDFPALYVRVKRLVAVRQHGRNIEENPCFTTCMWCGRLAECKAVQKAVYRAAKKFSPLKVPEDPNYAAAQVTSAVVSQWIQYADVCKAFGSAIRERFTDKVVEDPELCPESHNLVEQNLTKIDDQVKWRVFLRELGLEDKAVAPKTKITLEDSKRLISSLAERGQKTAFVEEVVERAKAAGLIVPDRKKIFLQVKRPSSD
jgi:hypothetical protein